MHVLCLLVPHQGTEWTFPSLPSAAHVLLIYQPLTAPNDTLTGPSLCPLHPPALLICPLWDRIQVPDVLLVLTAAQRALYAQAQGTMKARTLHMELLYQLSPRTNVRARPHACPCTLR